MAQKPALGHIDCPTCGMVGAMRITHDKNGDPFGYCEANCGQQMRIGGDKRRVRDFLSRFPQFAPAAEPAPAAPAAPPAPVTVTAKPAPAPAEKTPPKPRSAFEDALSALGVK